MKVFLDNESEFEIARQENNQFRERAPCEWRICGFRHACALYGLF